MFNPLPVRTTPLVAWLLVIMGSCMMFLVFLACEPLAYAFFGLMSNQDMPSEAYGPSTTLRLEWYAMPCIISILLVLWAYLVTTRRQPTTYPME